MNEQSPLRWKYPGPASSMDGSLSGPAFVLLMLSSGITYSTPVLFHLFEADLGIGRGQAAFIFSFSHVMAFVLGPIQRWFHKRRGFASGLATTGVSIGTLTFPMIAASAAGAFGWRSLYVGFAVVGLSVGLLAARPRAWIAGCIEMTLCANSAHPTKCPRAWALACLQGVRARRRGVSLFTFPIN